MDGLASVHFNSVAAAPGLLQSSNWRQREVGGGSQKSTEGLITVHNAGLRVAGTAEYNRPRLRNSETNYDQNLCYTVKDFQPSWRPFAPFAPVSCLKTASMTECWLPSGLRIALISKRGSAFCSTLRQSSTSRSLALNV